MACARKKRKQNPRSHKKLHRFHAYKSEIRKHKLERFKNTKMAQRSFFDKVFTEKEKAKIVFSEIENPKNKIYGKTEGNKTKDRVFLLSIEEAESFFSSDEERIAKATDFAVQNGTKTDSAGNCIWWLRTSGIDSKRFAVVSNAGYIYEIGSYADFDDRGIRPAMWIDLSLAE